MLKRLLFEKKNLIFMSLESISWSRIVFSLFSFLNKKRPNNDFNSVICRDTKKKTFYDCYLENSRTITAFELKKNNTCAKCTCYIKNAVSFVIKKKCELLNA